MRVAILPPGLDGHVVLVHASLEGLLVLLTLLDGEVAVLIGEELGDLSRRHVRMLRLRILAALGNIVEAAAGRLLRFLGDLHKLAQFLHVLA